MFYCSISISLINGNDEVLNACLSGVTVQGQSGKLSEK